MKQCYILIDADGEIIQAFSDEKAAIERAKYWEELLDYDGKERRVEIQRMINPEFVELNKLIG